MMLKNIKKEFLCAEIMWESLEEYNAFIDILRPKIACDKCEKQKV